MDNYIGVKFAKPLEDYEGYAAAAAWCNEHGATIVEREDCYEVIAIPEPAFAELAAAKRREIWGAGDAILAKVKSGFTEAEIESWSKQEQGARDISAGETETEAARFVSAIATARGLDVATLVAKILQNVATYAALSAAVIGEQQRLDDLIKAAASKEELDGIVWTKKFF